MKRILILCTLHLALCTIAMAVPARRGIHSMVQPNGDTLRVELVGDEWWHAYYTEDGYLIQQGEDGWWRYAKYSDKTYTDRRGHERKQIVDTRRKAKNEDQRGRCQKNWLKRNIPNRKTEE